MIKVSILYPNEPGKRFDMNYYCTSHMPMVKKLSGDACKGMAVEQGLGGGVPGSPPAYIAMGHLYYDSVETFQAAFAPDAEKIMADIPNYTDIQPVLQISEVKI